MSKSTRRSFLRTTAATGAGYFVAAGARPALSNSVLEKPNVVCIGVGNKGDSDSSNAAAFGNVVAICDVDRNTLKSKGASDGFKDAKQYTDYRELLANHGEKVQSATISTPEHMHAPATLQAMRMGINCYTQKPLTRTIYEARLMAEVAKETGVCTQMGVQSTTNDSAREAISQLRSGVLGALEEVHVWSNRPIWAQGPDRRMDMAKFAAIAKKENPDNADRLIAGMQKKVESELRKLDWENWLGVAPKREFWPKLYHSFQWRGWWDFGTGALGDMACHQLNVPFASCGLKDPVSVVAKTTGHDYDSFPASSTIQFEFPETSERPAIPFWWYDRKGNKPPLEKFEKFGINQISERGSLIIGEKGAFYNRDDYCGNWEFLGVEKAKVEWDKATNKGSADMNHMYELFEAVAAGNPMICDQNFINRGGPLTETILLGNLAVWAAAQGGPDGAMGDWGEKVQWDAKNLKVTNLDSLKTPGVADLIKPKYPEGYRLD